MKAITIEAISAGIETTLTAPIEGVWATRDKDGGLCLNFGGGAVIFTMPGDVAEELRAKM